METCDCCEGSGRYCHECGELTVECCCPEGSQRLGECPDCEGTGVLPVRKECPATIAGFKCELPAGHDGDHDCVLVAKDAWLGGEK